MTISLNILTMIQPKLLKELGMLARILVNKNDIR
jgi:hypothetical protein